MQQWFRSPSRRLQFLIVVCVSVFYCVCFLWVYATSGSSITALSLLPIMLIGWFSGWQAGMLAGIGFAALNLLLFGLVSPAGVALFGQEWPGALGSIVLGGGAGWANRVIRIFREQAAALERERELLQREIAIRRQTEAELLAAKEQAEEASRAKSAFLAHMSHELRTPLTIILGYADLIATQIDSSNPEQLRHDVVRIRQSGKHLLGLINNVLDLAKLESGKIELDLQPVYLRDLSHFLENMVHVLALEQHNHLIIRAVPEPDIWVLLDYSKLQQVLLNIVDNALKFTHHGTVTITISHELIAAVDQRNDQPETYRIMIDVQDTGIGIPAEDLPKLFQAFSRSHISEREHYRGTGIGLLVSRQFCRLMGGDIHISSVEGVGSTVSIVLIAQSANVAQGIPTTGAL